MKYQAYHLIQGPRWGLRLTWGLSPLAGLFLCAALASLRPLPLGAEPSALNLSASFLGTGSWDMDGNLTSREDLRLTSRRLTSQRLTSLGPDALSFTGRFQIVDKRPALFWEDWEAGNTAFSGGLYHNLTGSRLLGGILEEWGLPARLRNPWGKSLPFADAHKPFMADLRTAPSSTREPEAYLYLGSPRLGRFRPYASVQADGNLNPSFGAGLDTLFDAKTSLRTEGFYTRRHLAERTPSAWFAETPRLPERDFHLYGLGIFFTSPFVGAAMDGAYSETFAWGQDLYGNLALRLGDKPWKLNLGIETAGARFADRDGVNAGAAFRTAAQFEWKWKRSSFIRVSTRLRAPEAGEAFDRSNTVIYYHFPSNIKTNWAFPLQPVKISVTAARNAQDREKILDTAEAAIGFNVGPVRTAFQTTLSGLVDSGDTPAPADAGRAPFPYPGAAAYRFNSAKVTGNVSWSIGMFQFKAKLGYTGTKTKDPVWDTYLSATVRGKPGHFTVKVSSPDFPAQWSCSLSWLASGAYTRSVSTRKR